MFLEFRVKNYRSFKDEAVLSLIASKDRSLPENMIATGTRSIANVNRSAVIYGANASGKSNLLRGLAWMRALVMDSNKIQPGQPLNVQSFQLDLTSRENPSYFEISLLLDGVRQQYGFELTASRVTAEWLLVYETAKPQVWFERKYDAETNSDVYKFGSKFAGPKRLWQDATKANSLFLSTVNQLNSDRFSRLFQWFNNDLVVLLDGATLPHDYSTSILNTENGQHRIRELLSSADIAISGIAAYPTKGMTSSFVWDTLTGKHNSTIEEVELLMPKFKHSNGTLSAEFELGDESQGTQKLYSMAGPLFDILENGKVLFVDELDRSLHPLLVRQIITAFNDPRQNCSGAQLVFTTHDTSQLDASLFRRDQIWLTERREDHSSGLIPLTDFSPRKGEALERGYLSGRYGGVPILSNRLLAGADCG